MVKAGVTVVVLAICLLLCSGRVQSGASCTLLARRSARDGRVILAFWTLVVCLAVTTGATFSTTPKPEAELKDLVMGLTQRPNEGPAPGTNAWLGCLS